MNNIKNANIRVEASKILESNALNNDEKLLLIFKKYEESLQGTPLYYALLAWKDSHIKELRHLL